MALLCVAQITFAEVLPSVTLTEYYAAVNNKSGDAIRTALYNKISPHTTVSYDNLKYLFRWTDSYDNAGVTIDDIYSFCDPAYTEAWCSGTCGYNREHSVPKSWFNEASVLYSDAFHLYPTNCYVNSYRGNEPFGECANGTKCTTNGVNARGRKGTSTFSDGGTSYASVGTVYEPDDEFKGDLARTYFYMVTCYMNNRFNYADGGIKMFTWQNNTADLSAYSVALLLKWHRQDPVSERELARNEVIYGNAELNKCSYNQGNRNPFIDYPELAEYIWGNKKGQPVVLAALVSAYDGETPPTPPTPTVKHGVNWSVNGEIILTDSIMENGIIVNLPDEPSSCSTESSEFMGWTNAAISGTTDDAPAVLYTTVDAFPAVTEDVTYYAVFAHMEEIEGGEPQIANETIVFKDKNFPNGTTVTSVEQGYATITFTNAKYYESGESVRVYGGGTMTVSGPNVSRIELAFGNSDGSNVITTNVGNYTEPIWTGLADAVTFSVATGSGHRKIASVFVQFNGASGTSVEYSRYITTCQETSELIPTPVTQRAAKKVLIGGHIYIQTEEGLFTITGQRVK